MKYIQLSHLSPATFEDYMQAFLDDAERRGGSEALEAYIENRENQLSPQEAANQAADESVNSYNSQIMEQVNE